MKIRIPGWAQNEAIPGGLYKFTDQDTDQVSLMINGKKSELNLVDGYAVVSRKWKQGDIVEINFPMPVRKVVADEKVKEDVDKIAFQRGPVIYCAEWPEFQLEMFWIWLLKRTLLSELNLILHYLKVPR